ncbi:metal-dependent hydrolase [Thermus sp.]|uniref:metal-dependent hydrolase n=1 Tax=Thermus sp. TaxID=275 RepID=UPI0025FA1DA1|nr:metal-dependent hydrolase [Thermus sp.]MDW8358776.1 metal-dependent hydrolase [Thermus sp.]
MTAGTHLAGAALTAGLLRGLGLEVGVVEGLALAWGSLMPDVDTTTSGPGKFIRPLSSWLERRFGHRTLTHSLPFTAALALFLYPLLRVNPSAYWAFLAGYLSHLLLDTLNVNGVPLLWPWRMQFWFFAAREWRIRYASPQEATLALSLALFAFAFWPLSAQGFASAFRHLVGTPEVAVLDYLDWRERREVWAEVRGFNRETQEAVEGRFLVVEALGREGFLMEDELGRTLAVSRDGQVVAYRVRMHRGRPQVLREWRLDLSGRLLGDLLQALPREARRVWITGEAAPATEPPPLVPPVGTYPRVKASTTPPRLVLHAARPEDLTSLAGLYLRAGSAVVRAAFSPEGAGEASLLLPHLPSLPRVHPVLIPDLPSLSALLVRPGDAVEEGEPLARYVDEVPLEELAQQAQSRREEASRLEGELARLEERFRSEREALMGELARAREERDRLRYLVAQGAEPRLKLQEAEARTEELSARLKRLVLDYTGERARLEERLREAGLEAVRLERRRDREAERQLVRSPVAGRVAEVKVRDITPKGVTVEVVVLGSGP